MICCGALCGPVHAARRHPSSRRSGTAVVRPAPIRSRMSGLSGADGRPLDVVLLCDLLGAVSELTCGPLGVSLLVEERGDGLAERVRCDPLQAGVCADLPPLTPHVGRGEPGANPGSEDRINRVVSSGEFAVPVARPTPPSSCTVLRLCWCAVGSARRVCQGRHGHRQARIIEAYAAIRPGTKASGKGHLTPRRLRERRPRHPRGLHRYPTIPARAQRHPTTPAHRTLSSVATASVPRAGQPGGDTRPIRQRSPSRPR